MRAVHSSARHLLVAALAIITLFLGLLGTEQAAQAAVNPAIRVTINSLVATNAQNETSPSSAVRVGDLARLDFTWDASDPAVTGGDSFEVEYAPYFEAREAGVTLELASGGLKVGSCVVETRKLVCTFDDTFTERKQIDPRIVGAGFVQVKALQQTTDETVLMKTNGQDVSVDLPGTGGIRGPRNPAFTPTTFTKSATPMSTVSSKTVNYTIGFNITYVNEQRVAAGLAPLPVDGTVSSFDITDVLGPGQVMPTNMNFVRILEAAPATRETLATLTRVYKENHALALNASADGTSGTITVTAPFREDANYAIGLSAVIVNGGTTQTLAIPGVAYTNTATITGTGASVTARQWAVQSADVSVSLNEGFGGFSVHKIVSGDWLAVAAGTTFPMSVTYTLPAGTTVSSYPAWTAPGVVNADGSGGTFTFDAKMGSSIPWTGTLPAGTRVTVEEDLSGVTPEPIGLSWGTPAYQVGNSSTNTFIIGNKTSATVRVTNTAMKAFGTFEVAKVVTGAEGENLDFTFAFTCDDGSNGGAGTTGTLTVKGDGLPVAAAEQIPLNATCTVTEDTAAAAARVPDHDLAEVAPQTVKITSATDPARLTFTNAYTAHTGTFQITKEVTGVEAGDRAFTFTYTCTDGSQGTVEAKGDAVPVLVGRHFAVGTSCTVSEDVAGSQIKGYTLASPEAKTVTIAVKDEVASVQFTNAYTAVPGEGESGTAAGNKGLARTGLEAGMAIAGAGALAILGMGALFLRRRNA